MEDFQNGLEELKSYLNNGKKILSKEEANRVEELFLDLSNEDKTEDIIVKTIEKIHVFSDKDDERRINPDGIKKICNAIPSELKNQNLFFEVVDAIKEYSSKAAYDDEEVVRPNTMSLQIFAEEMYEIFQSKDIVLKFLNSVKEYTYKENKFFPNNSMCQWILDNVPNNLKSQDLYNAITENMPDGVNVRVDKVDKEFIDETLVDLIVSKMDKSYFGGVDSLINQLPEHLRTQEYVMEIINRFDNNQYDVQDLWKLLPVENKNKEIYMLLAQKASLGSEVKLMQEIPDEFIDENLYKSLIFQIPDKKYINSYDLTEFLKHIPKEYLKEEYVVETINNIKDEYNAFEAIKTTSKIFDYSIDSYKSFMKKNTKQAFRIFEMIPKEELTSKFLLEQIENKNVFLPMSFIETFPIEKMNQGLIADIIHVFEKKEESVNRDDDLAYITHFMEYLAKNNLANQEVGAIILDNLKEYIDENGDKIYTPYMVRNIYNSFMADSDYYEPNIKSYFENLVDYEINHPNAYIDNPKQTSEYVREMLTNKKYKLTSSINLVGWIKISGRIDPEVKTTLYNLSVVLQCMPEALKDDKLKEKVNEFFNKEIESYKNENNEKAIRYLKEFYKNNDEIFMNLDKRIIENDKYINILGADKLEVLANYSDIQNTIANLPDNKLTLFSKIIDYVADSTKSRESDVGDWIPMADRILDKLNDDSKFKKLFTELSQIGYENISEKHKNKLLNIAHNSQNWFEINDLSGLDNYEEIKRNICLQILREPDNNKGIPEEILKLSDVERAKFAKLQLTYGIDLVQANAMIKKYGEKINENLENKDIGKILLAIKQIYNNDNLELLRDVRETDLFEADYNIMLNIESKYREHYLNEYKDTLYTVNENEKFHIDAQYDGKKIDVFEPENDFNMIIHAVGAYSQKNQIQNYKDAWNISKMESHSLCTSYIGNNLIATARIVEVVYGFKDFPQEQLLLSAPWDIVSKYDNMNFATANARFDTGNGVRFLSPEDEIDNTRHTHNEMVFDRRVFEKGEHYKKLQPSYLVYIPDYTEDLKVFNRETNEHEIKLQRS